jgi:hypothetical protein
LAGLAAPGIRGKIPFPRIRRAHIHAEKAGGFQRKGAKTQGRKEEVGVANPSHQTVSVGLGASSAVFLCVFVPSRLCVKIPFHGSGLGEDLSVLRTNSSFLRFVFCISHSLRLTWADFARHP